MQYYPGKIYEPWILEGTGTWEGHTALGILLQELSSSRRSRRQDVRHGNPIRQCRGFNSNRECAGPPHWVLLAAPSPMQPTELLTGPPLEGFSHGPWGCKGLGFWRWMPDGSSLPFWVGVPVCVTWCLPLIGLQSAQRHCCFHTAPSCPTANKNAVESVQYGVAGSAAFLECQPRSPQATVKWLFQRDPSDRRREVISFAPQSSRGCGSLLYSRNSTWVKGGVGANLGQPSF